MGNERTSKLTPKKKGVRTEPQRVILGQIDQVVMFKAHDGQMFPTQDAALKYNAHAYLKAEFAKALRSPVLGDAAITEDDRGNPVVFKDDLPQFLADNADLLRAVLKSLDEEYIS